MYQTRGVRRRMFRTATFTPIQSGRACGITAYDSAVCIARRATDPRCVGCPMQVRRSYDERLEGWPVTS